MKSLMIALSLAGTAFAATAAAAPADAQPRHGYYRASPRYSYYHGRRWERAPGWNRGGYRWRNDYRRRYYYQQHGRRYYGWR